VLGQSSTASCSRYLRSEERKRKRVREEENEEDFRVPRRHTTQEGCKSTRGGVHEHKRRVAQAHGMHKHTYETSGAKRRTLLFSCSIATI